MRIGIMTFHKAPSCGAQLQAWALKTVLGRMGHSVSFPDCNSMGTFTDRWPFRPVPRRGLLKTLRGRWKDFLNNLGSIGVFRPAMERYDRFRIEQLPETHVAPSEFGSCFDAVVYGSDQVWNPALTRTDAGVFLGEGVEKSVRKVAYAVSVGDGEPSPEHLDRIRAAAADYAKVSVREGKVAAMIAPMRKEESVVVADPTLLLTADDYRALASDRPAGEKYLYYYALYHHGEVYEKVAALARGLGLKLVYTPLYQYSRRKMPRGTVYGVSPCDFVSYMADAECVVTDSFHGTAFALIHGKPFVTYSLAPGKSESRPGALLGRLGIPERLMPWFAPPEDMLRLLKTPVSDSVKTALAAFGAESREWLRAALEW